MTLFCFLLSYGRMDRRFSACGGNGQASQVGMDSEFQLDLDVSPMVPCSTCLFILCMLSV